MIRDWPRKSADRFSSARSRIFRGLEPSQDPVFFFEKKQPAKKENLKSQRIFTKTVKPAGYKRQNWECDPHVYLPYTTLPAGRTATGTEPLVLLWYVCSLISLCRNPTYLFEGAGYHLSTYHAIPGAPRVINSRQLANRLVIDDTGIHSGHILTLEDHRKSKFFQTDVLPKNNRRRSTTVWWPESSQRVQG